MAERKFRDRVKNAWNAFRGNEVANFNRNYGVSYGGARPDRVRFTRGNERTIITSIYNRIALDIAQLDIKHCRVDEEGRYLEDIKSGLNNCLTIEANLDQSAFAFKLDMILSMFDEGYIACIPIDTDDNPDFSDSYTINTMRVGKILEWYPKHIKVRAYDQNTGKFADIMCAKSDAAIIENPFYSVINEPNSVMRRLVRKLALLDYVDEQTGTGKIDMIIQLPYSLKTEAKRAEADKRRRDLETQLTGSRYGVAYIDSTERVTQLNRSLDNNLLAQIENLTSTLYSQLGITQSVLDGTADEQTMLNYQTRAVDPIVQAIVEEFNRKFITPTARTQGHRIMVFKDPFKLVPVNNIADIADKFTRNEIMTSNEIRQAIGLKPSNDPKADMLVNSNLNMSEQMESQINGTQPMVDENGIPIAEEVENYEVEEIPNA